MKRIADYFDDSFFQTFGEISYILSIRGQRFGYLKNYQILSKYFYCQKILG
jgi:hypothetical protein